MAFLSNIDDISSMFKKSETLKILYDYLSSATDKSNDIYKRILMLDCSNGRAENKFDLGFDMVAIEQSYTLNNEGIFESHKKFVDFQLVVYGDECMEVGHIYNFNATNKYNEDRDVINYSRFSEVSKIFLYPKSLLVLFPNDIHAGGFRLKSDIVFKSVVKVPLELLKFGF